MTRPTSVLTAGVSLILGWLSGNSWRASHNLELSPLSSTVMKGTFENTLNDLDHRGYVPWELRYIDVRDSQDSVNPRKVVRILARRKWVSEQLPK